jgi:prepilin-type processing-associated H-X9-DG protein
MDAFESKPEPEQEKLFMPPGTREWEKQERKDTGWNRLTLLFVGVLFLAFLASGVLKLVGSAREAAKKASCNCHLKQFGLALHNYLAANGCFPPAYTVDDQGRKMHSWRALLLPYFEAGTSPVNYNINEPWDSPNNRKAWDQMPSTFRCPSDDSSPPNTTSYVAIVGPTTMWPGAKRVTADDITDGLSNTIAIVEAKNLAVPWLEPRDLDEESLSLIINDKATKNALSSAHSDGVNVMLADGSVRFLLRSIDPKLLKELLTIAGGEPAVVP